MSAFVLVTGTIFRKPEQRQSKAGKPFVTATVRAKDGDTSQFWKVVVFSEPAQAELLRLQDGDAVTLQGAMRAELYEKDGQHRISYSIVADAVLALRQPAKKRETESPNTRPHEDRRRDSWQRPLDGPDDVIPF